MSTPPLPSFVVVGAPRSGTTSLWHYLRVHPDVFMAPKKELQFFTSATMPGGIEGYRANFKGWRGEQAVGEASPQYMYSGEAMQRMASALPDARLLVLLRNPVDRAYSEYWRRKSNGRETRSFGNVVASGHSNGRETRSFGDVVASGHANYMERSRYLPFLERVSELYPREALRVELFEELTHRPRDVYRSVCEHLGISTEFAPPGLGERTNSFVRFRSLRFRKFHRRLPGHLRKIVGRLNATKDTYPEMDHSLRGELLAEFREDNARLAAWLGRDLAIWEMGFEP